MYWVRERSVWRMESLRFRVGFVVGFVDVGSEAAAVRSSIFSIWRIRILFSYLVISLARYSVYSSSNIACLLSSIGG